MFVVRSQWQVNRGFVDDVVPEEFGETEKSAAPSVSGCFERLKPVPVVIYEAHNLVTKLWTAGDLTGELDGPFVCAHNQHEPPIPSTTPQGEEK
jgi:hypothetical protein